jgi:hypothetical protein
VLDISALLTTDNPIVKRFNNVFYYSAHRLAPRTRGDVIRISAGVLATTDPIHRIEPEALAATDDLDTITGGIQDDILILAINNNARQVRVRNVDNIKLKAWRWLFNTHARLVLRKDENGLWVEESYNPGIPLNQLEAGADLEIASGAVTVSSNRHKVDTEGLAAADDLVTITPSQPFAEFTLYLRAVDGGRTVTLKHGTGNIFLYGAADVTLNAQHDIELFWDPGGLVWTDRKPT